MDKIEEVGKHTFASLEIKNYRLYFIGQGISVTGTWMQSIAQGLLVLQLTGSGTALGTVMAMQFLPILFFGPLAGVITDRYHKRTILFFTQTIAGLLALTLGLLLAFHLVKIWMIYIFAICLGLINAIDNPTRNSFLVEMVGKNLIKNAVALNFSEVNLGRVFAPLFAGSLIASVGIVACFFFNAISYLAVIFVLLLMDTKKLHTPEPARVASGQVMEGFRYINSSPILRNTLIILAITGALSYEFSVILPLFAEFTFNNTILGYTALTAALGFGSLIGGLASANRERATHKKLVLSTWLFGIAMLFLALTPTLLMATFVMIFVGISSVNFMSIANTLLQTHTIAEMRGRVMSLWTVAFLGSTPIGGPIVGWIGEHIGPRWGLILGGFAAIAAGSLGMILFNKVKAMHIHFTPDVEKAMLQPAEASVHQNQNSRYE